jgi:hypothetical protein
MLRRILLKPNLKFKRFNNSNQLNSSIPEDINQDSKDRTGVKFKDEFCGVGAEVKDKFSKEHYSSKEECQENKMREKDIIHCLDVLYNNTFKNHFNAVEIYKESWSEEEIIALASIFTYCNVRYVVLDKFGRVIPY